MENAEFAEILSRIGRLLELAGESSFRVRAYRNAAETIEGQGASIGSLIDSGARLEELPGIGKAIAAKLVELHDTGRLRYLDELEKKVPPALFELLSIQGLGPRRVRELWTKCEIASIDDLDAALSSGKLEGLSGFGTGLLKKMAKGIVEVRSRAGRVRLSDAEKVVGPLVEHLHGASGIASLDVVGSLRRRRETVGDIDILVTADDATGAMQRFVSYGRVHEILAHGETKSSVELAGGLQVDLRVVEAESRGAAQHYFTGSKAHNVALRTLAKRHGLRVNEYGVFRGEEKIAGETESGVYEALGLAWVEPELREDRGEIVAAREGALPRLVELDDMRGDLQMHSTWSDGKSSPREMAEACWSRGYEYMALTDHSQAVRVAGGLSPDEFLEQFDEIDALQQELDGITLFKSGEVDILGDGSLDVPEKVLERMDLALVSVHSKFDMPKNEMTRRIVAAFRHPKVRILGHPTGRLIGQREPYALDVEEIVRAAAGEGVALELNAHPHRLDLNDVNVRLAQEAGVEIVISTDSHSVAGLGNMRYGVGQARRGWLGKGDVLNTRPLSGFLDWLGAD